MKLGRYPGEGKNSQTSNLFSRFRLYKPAKRGLASPLALGKDSPVTERLSVAQEAKMLARDHKNTFRFFSKRQSRSLVGAVRSYG